MAVVINGRNYLLSFSMENAALEHITWKKIATENWISVLVCKERMRGAVLKQCND